MNDLQKIMAQLARIEDHVSHIRYGEGQAHATAIMQLANAGDTEAYQQQQMAGQLGPPWDETIRKQQEALRRRAAGEPEV